MTFHLYWIVFVVSFVAVAEWESRARRRNLTTPEERRWLGNGALTLMSLVLQWSLARVTPVVVAALVAGGGFGLVHPSWLPRPLAWVLAVALLDFGRYAVHVAYHRIPILWRVHQVHHSDPDLDLSTGLRAHPLETLITQGAHLALIALLAPPVGAVVLAECLFCFQAFFVHANARLPERLEARLRYLIVTPDMHRIHHSDRESEQNRNYGDVSPWWDWIFGTYLESPEGGQEALVPGLHGFQTTRSLDPRFMLGLPFARPAVPVQSSDGAGRS